MFFTIITFIIVLSILVFAHELGHFWLARKFGVKAEEFGFGFPPRAWGIYKDERGKWKQVFGTREIKDSPGTVFSLNWVPLGGFVKIKGENGENESENDSFANRPVWQRAFMLSAGVSMNLILASVLISIGLMIGLPQVVDSGQTGAEISGRKIQIIQVLPDSPAELAGLKMGDVILSIDGNVFSSEEEVQNFAGDRTGKELLYKIQRGQAEIEYKLIPEIIEEANRGGIGVAIVTVGLVKYPVWQAIWEGIKTTVILVWFIIVAFYELIKGIILGQGLSQDLAGPVGIATITGQVARMGFIYVLQFTALLSINLAIINFLPFPALDGGRFLFLVIEKIKGSPVKREIEALIHNIGFILLMILVLAVTLRDVAKFGNVFQGLWNKIL